MVVTLTSIQQTLPLASFTIVLTRPVIFIQDLNNKNQLHPDLLARFALARPTMTSPRELRSAA
jgi:hypothetical protein